MLYDRKLDTFVACARLGSFSQAAELLYLTPTAVMKQITQLEEELNLTLFHRTYRGLDLTASGIQLLTEVENLKDWTDKAMSRIRQASSQANKQIRIGTSILTPPNLIADLWPKVQSQIPDISFQLISFENKPEIARQILTTLGNDIDIVAGFFDQKLLTQYGCQGLPIKNCAICLGVPFGHRLWNYKKISLIELQGEHLLGIVPGWTNGTDALYEQIQKIRDLTMEFFPFFRPAEFARVINEQKLILAFDVWQTIHPLLRIIPVEWEAVIPYGFLYSFKPSAPTQSFLEAIKQII